MRENYVPSSCEENEFGLFGQCGQKGQRRGQKEGFEYRDISDLQIIWIWGPC